MAKSKSIELLLKEKLAKIKETGLLKPEPILESEEEKQKNECLSLEDRVQKILGIVKKKSTKNSHMNFLVLYDISDNKVRTLVSKYLEKKGCIRIQKSVFLGNAKHKIFMEIKETMADINSYYDNKDSILLIPINVSDVRSMKIIGKNINIETLIDPPNTLFF